jgi:hypothetical protein
VLFLMLLMPLGLLFMLRGLERYERLLDVPADVRREARVEARAARARQRVVTVESPATGVVARTTAVEAEPAA